MLKVECKKCGAFVWTDNGLTPNAVLNCGCCSQLHDHDESANSCRGIQEGHPGQACSEADPLTCVAVTPEGEDCPGEHCGAGVIGCAVCRPVNIIIYGVAVA